MHVLLLHNPGAGDEDHPPRDLISLLERAGHEVIWRSLADSSWPEALELEPELVAIAGGDGSVQTVLPGLIGTGCRATLLPLGSANNVALSAGFPDADPERLIAGWETASIHGFDVMAVGEGADEHLFVESAGSGLFTDALRRADEQSDELPSEEKLRNSLELLRACVLEADPYPWPLQVSGEDLEVELIALELMNASTSGPNLPLAPAADPSDGLLDLVLVRPDDREPLVTYLEERLAEREADMPLLETRTAAAVRFRSPGIHLHIDDAVVAPPRTSYVTARCVGQVPLLVPTRNA